MQAEVSHARPDTLQLHTSTWRQGGRHAAYRVRAAWATSVLPFPAAVLRLSFWVGPRILILLVDFTKQGMPREVGSYVHCLLNLMHIFHAHFHAWNMPVCMYRKCTTWCTISMHIFLNEQHILHGFWGLFSSPWKFFHARPCTNLHSLLRISFGA